MDFGLLGTLTVNSKFKIRFYQLAIIIYPIGKNETIVEFMRQVTRLKFRANLHILIRNNVVPLFYFRQCYILNVSPTFEEEKRDVFKTLCQTPKYASAFEEIQSWPSFTPNQEMFRKN